MKYCSRLRFYSVADLADRLSTVMLLVTLLCLCQPEGAAQTISPSVQDFVCRVSNQLAGEKNVGSGTLIDKTPDGREGLVLTCAHLLRDGTGELLTTFSNGRRHRAKLIAIDQQADLAMLAIAFPTGKPAEMAFSIGQRAKLHACGYGPRGIYRCAAGFSVGNAASAGQTSLLIGDAVRPGDSGGGVFDEQGRLVAVIWGEAHGVTYASYGKPLQRFVSRVLGQQTSTVYSCPNGVCPRQPNRLLPSRREPLPGPDSRWKDFQRQLDELRAQKQDRGDYLTRSELPDFDSYVRSEEVQHLQQVANQRHATLLDRLQIIDGRQIGKAAGSAVAGLLGLSGPVGWAVVAAASVGGWLVGRRMKRRLRDAGGRRRRRF